MNFEVQRIWVQISVPPSKLTFLSLSSLLFSTKGGSNYKATNED